MPLTLPWEFPHAVELALPVMALMQLTPLVLPEQIPAAPLMPPLRQPHEDSPLHSSSLWQTPPGATLGVRQTGPQTLAAPVLSLAEQKRPDWHHRLLAAVYGRVYEFEQRWPAPTFGTHEPMLTLSLLLLQNEVVAQAASRLQAPVAPAEPAATHTAALQIPERQDTSVLDAQAMPVAILAVQTLLKQYAPDTQAPSRKVTAAIDEDGS